MTDAWRVLAIIPCLDEEASLPAVLADLDACRKSLDAVIDVLVVDDGSSDNTAAVAARGGARVARLCGNLGIGAAVQTGLRLAYRERYDCAVQLDGDGQHPAAEMPRLVERLRVSPAADLVIGSRFLDGKGYQSTIIRRAGIRWLALVLRILTSTRTRDVTSGFRAYGARALAVFAREYPYDYPEPESFVIAAREGLAVAEVPVRMRQRSHGESTIRGLATMYYMLKVTMAISLDRLRGRMRGGRNGS